MRRTIGLFLIIIIVSLGACKREGRAYRIAVSQCASGQWREKVNSEMLAAQHLYEQAAEVTIACAYDDTERQIQQIDSLAASGIDLLVVAPTESAPLAEAIARVRAAGIPVIFFDRKASTYDYTAFIGGDNVEAGRTVGEYIPTLFLPHAAKSPSRPVVLEITGAMSSSPAQERHEGFAKAMKEHPELEYICAEGDWTSDKACSIVEKQIRAGHRPDVVFCHNDGMATGVYKAAVETGLEGQIKILGIDGMPYEGLEYVKLGHQVGTYVYPTHGEEIVRLALNILMDKPYERENVLQGMMVTPANVDLIALNSRELLKQNDNLITIEDKLERYFGVVDIQNKVIIAAVVTILLLITAFVLILRALIQTRKAIRQRQRVNEEQTLFYTDASSRKLHEIFDRPDDDLPPPRTQDMIFAEQLNEAIRKHMSNPNLKMDELGEELGLSRVQLYRKVKAITGQSPVELLRQMRLQRAYALLQSTNKTVQEIAFEVGFNTPGYFSKCFREQFGKYSTELRDS